MLRGSVIGIAAWACLAFAGSAAACTPVTGYRIPTNLEYVTSTPTILVGRVTKWDFRKAPDQRRYEETSLLIEPVLILKGNGPPGPFKLIGMLAISHGSGEAGAAGRSQFDEFQSPHPDAFTGACLRYNFVVGQMVVFFLRSRDGQLVPAAGPFMRWAEDVPSLDGPWVRLVRIYLQAAALAKPRQRALLMREKAKLLAGKPNRTSKLMAKDIQRQLDGVAFLF